MQIIFPCIIFFIPYNEKSNEGRKFNECVKKHYTGNYNIKKVLSMFLTAKSNKRDKITPINYFVLGF